MQRMSVTNKIAQASRARNKNRNVVQHPSDAEPVTVFITELSNNDILLGRGFPVRSREANRKFRELVLRYKPEYKATGKHAVKERIARDILGIVFGEGGRFVRRIEAEERRAWRVPKIVAEAWIVVSDDVAKEKCKQALRDSGCPSPAAVKARKLTPKELQQKQKSTQNLSQMEQLQHIPLTFAGQGKASTNGSPATRQNMQKTVSNVVAPYSILQRDQLFSPALLDDDELSYGLKHPSHRKRYLLRLRQLQRNKEQRIISYGSISSTSAPVEAATRGIAKHSEDYRIVASARSQPDTDKVNNDRSMSNVSYSSSSSASIDDDDDDDDIGGKPRARKIIQR